MVTVIAEKEELSTPINNGVTIGSNDNEQSFQYIKDYQEVDFHRSISCKPLPEDLLEINTNGQITKSFIKGTFFVQIDAIEPIIEFNNINKQIEQTNDNNSLLLTITDGIITVKGITNDYIPDLSFNTRPGCKLLLTGVISIKNDLLQLTHDNTRFQHGSNTYSRPRTGYRGRGGGSYRPSYEGRRGGGGNKNSNTRYDNDDNESNFFKRPPPKNTLMDFMTSLKISNDTKQIVDNDNQKINERYDNKRRNPEQSYHTNKINNINTTNTMTSNNSNHYKQSNNNSTDHITHQQDGINEQLDSEDDPSHSNYRERRNPLPPRLQRAQEERTRRNTIRYYDESTSLNGNEINGNYNDGTQNNHSLSSTSRRTDQISYIPNNPSNGQQHPPTLNTYVPHTNMIATVNGSTQAHLAYFQANSTPLTYGIGGISNPSYHNQQASMGCSYTNDHLTYCYGHPYGTPTYLPSSVSNGYNNDSKTYNNSSNLQTNSFIDKNEIKSINESQQNNNNENENENEKKPQNSMNEQKAPSSSSSSSSLSSSSLNDGNNNSQQKNITEQNEDKRRDANSNPRIRWRIGDICLARWSGDREYYVATIVQIQPPYCTVLFRDYHNYDQVHFNDLKLLSRDQQYYQFIPSIATPSSDLNALGANPYYSSRTNYYSSTIDGCVMMPEAPPFPFNSAGTLYICPPTLTSLSRSNRSSSFQQSNRHIENGNNHSNVDTTINSSLSLSKDSNDISINDSITTSNDDNQQGIQSCSIADIPLKLVTKDDEYERNTSTESLTSSKYDEQQSTNEENKQENNSVVNAN